MSRIEVTSFLKILIGNILLGFAYAKWMKPNAIINGGVTSLAMIIEKVTPINILFLTNGITLFLLTLCFLFLGRESLLKSIFSSVCYNLFFSLFYLWPIDMQINLPVDLLLACLFISGGYYCCLSANASTVGMDVIALILYKKNPRLNLAYTIRYINYSVLFAGLFTYGLKSVVIGILFSFIYSYLLNLLLKAHEQGLLI